jgi:hypothetical protein
LSEAARQAAVASLVSMGPSKADWRRIVMASVTLLLQKNREHGLRAHFLV